MTIAEINLDSRDDVSPHTLDELGAELARQMVGLPYLFARSTHANELTLHFGAERPHTHPKLAGKVRGTHVLSVRGSAWLLHSGVKRVVVGSGVVPVIVPSGGTRPFNVTALESGALIGSAATVAVASPFAMEPTNAIGLEIELSDGSRFTILPTPPGDDGDGLPEPADWEILTPTRLLRTGPGPRFSVEDNGPRAG